MSTKVTKITGAPKGNPAVLATDAEDKSLVLKRQALRAAIERTGWTHEAIAAAMREKGLQGVDGPYVSKMLSGEKPIGLKHIDALPDDVEAAYHQIEAERFGLFVVVPVDDATADRYIAIALCSKLAKVSQQPHAARMAKADLPLSQKPKVVNA